MLFKKKTLVHQMPWLRLDEIFNCGKTPLFTDRKLKLEFRNLLLAYNWYVKRNIQSSVPILTDWG
jgi:hypothetical protein